MTLLSDAFVQLTAQAGALDLALDTIKVQLESDDPVTPSFAASFHAVADEIHVMEKWQMELAAKVAKVYSIPTGMITTAGPQQQAQTVYSAAKSMIREAEFTMEFQMTPRALSDPFDPFKVEAGCAHPDDYREPLPYHGAAPSDDEWLCSGCGYWKKGKAFGVTPLPQPEPLTDKELDELLERQAKTSVSDTRDQWLGVDLAANSDEAVIASFPISYPRLPMVNSHSSHNSIKALMHELEARNRQRATILYSPDITTSANAGMITELRLIMQYNDVTTPIKAVIDGIYTLESVGTMFVRSSELHFEAHPRTIHALAREFLTPATPLVNPSLGQLRQSIPWKMLGRDLREQCLFNPGMIAMALT